MFDLPNRKEKNKNFDKITLQWGIINIQKKQGRLILYKV